MRRGPSAAAELAARVDLLQLEPHAQPQAALVKAAVALERHIAVLRDGGERGRVEQARRRRLHDGKIPRLPAAWYTAAPLTAPPFAIATPPAVGIVDAPDHDEPSAGRAGTLSIDASASQDVTSLIAMRMAREISRPTFLNEVKRRGILSDLVDVDEEIRRVEDEGPELPMPGDPNKPGAKKPAPRDGAAA